MVLSIVLYGMGLAIFAHFRLQLKWLTRQAPFERQAQLRAQQQQYSGRLSRLPLPRVLRDTVPLVQARSVGCVHCLRSLRILLGPATSGKVFEQRGNALCNCRVSVVLPEIYIRLDSFQQ